MKIAFFSKHLPSDQPNGVSVQVHRLAEELVSLGHEVTVFSFSPAPENARYLCLQLDWGTPSKLVRKFIPAIRFRCIDTRAFDIVHYHGDDYLCHGSHRRIRTFYGTAIQEALHAFRGGRCLYQLLFYLFELVSCLRKGELVTISRHTRAFLPRIRHYIPCAVPNDKYKPGPARSNHPSILFIGDLHSRKRGYLLVRAFHEQILPQFPECKLTIVGPEPCAGKNIIYAGRLNENELIDAFKMSWVYCLPSSYEGFGVPVIEAMASGAAVVATSSPAVKEVVVNECNGLLCSPQNLGPTLIRVLGDNDLRSRLTHHATEIAELFDSKLIAQSYEKIYRSCLSRSTPAT